MLNRLFIPIILSLLSSHSSAATVDTISIHSKAMNKNIKCVVIKPETEQNKAVPLPVVYLLHGYSGNFSNWITRVPQLKSYADQYKLMIVCPDGANSWYIDSPVDSALRYETYIYQEVVSYIDEHYPTIKDRSGRAITGLSMGGHGGMFIGLRHSNLFGACGSMSGGVNLDLFRKSFEITKTLGDTITYANNWKNYSIINLVERYTKTDSLAMIIDCGTEDFFYDVNHALHEKMVRLKIPHEYIERPGKHDWAYWGNAVEVQLLYFSKFFKKK